MTSPRRRQDRPVESVTLKITFKAKEVETAKIMEAFPSAVMRGGLCEVKIEADEPAEAAERARALLERLRAAA